MRCRASSRRSAGRSSPRAIVALAVGYGWGLLEIIAIGWGLVVLVSVAALWLIGRGAGEIRLLVPTPRVVVGEPAARPARRGEPGPPRVRRRAARAPGRREGLRARASASGTRQRVRRAVRDPDRAAGDRVGRPRPNRARRPHRPHAARDRVVRDGRAARASRARCRSARSAPASSATSRASPTRDLTSSDIAFHALREYVPGRRPSLHPLAQLGEDGHLHGAPVRGDASQPAHDPARPRTRGVRRRCRVRARRRRGGIGRRTSHPRRPQRLVRGVGSAFRERQPTRRPDARTARRSRGIGSSTRSA